MNWRTGYNPALVSPLHCRSPFVLERRRGALIAPRIVPTRTQNPRQTMAVRTARPALWLAWHTEHSMPDRQGLSGCSGIARETALRCAIETARKMSPDLPGHFD